MGTIVFPWSVKRDRFLWPPVNLVFGMSDQCLHRGHSGAHESPLSFEQREGSHQRSQERVLNREGGESIFYNFLGF